MSQVVSSLLVLQELVASMWNPVFQEHIFATVQPLSVWRTHKFNYISVVEDSAPHVVGSLPPSWRVWCACVQPYSKWSLQVKWFRTLLKPHLCNNKSRLWRKYQNKLLSLPVWWSGNFKITGVEVSAPQAVGTCLPSEEFDALVYNQIHQEQIVTGETTRNTFENPAVPE